ncbi:hypothetical protein MIH18_03500 [Marinobacter sp. M3C]|uniref:hypothetical protein n=1 Tax=Marinobacter sp. M3C TaxID=2917715 RepID=UPI00200D0F77|nr:hypothetical protein [Marinobacter sp. M3C]UQG61029.1 hypothetical protein MIH18_03500 [Marinobacter sp. M3C]
MHQFKRWIIELKHWLKEAKLIFIGVFVILLAVFFGFVVWPTEKSIRIIGYVLQLIGMIVAVKGLFMVRSHFGHPSLGIMCLRWLKRFPKWKVEAHISVPTAYSVMTALDPHVEAWAPDNPESTLEHRLNAVIKNLGQLRADQGSQKKLINSLATEHQEHEKKTAKERVEIQEKIQKNLESLHTGYLVTSLLGLVWLLVGITMSTLALELSM